MIILCSSLHVVASCFKQFPIFQMVLYFDPFFQIHEVLPSANANIFCSFLFFINTLNSSDYKTYAGRILPDRTIQVNKEYWSKFWVCS